jgi:hypothetical protein
MQTFLPYPDYQLSLDSLDNRRLGKQRVEALQIMNVIEGRSQGWQHHPAVKMWIGNRDHLAYYHNLSLEIWVKRTFVNRMDFMYVPADLPERPWFIGFDLFHQSHRSNLKRKDSKYYKFDDPDDLPYVWPHGTEHKYYLATIKNGWINEH